MRHVPLAAGKYGRLTVISQESVKMVVCACECGSPPKSYRAVSVKHGNTRSCGCLAKEVRIARGRSSATHGLSKTRVFAIWSGMINRCENQNSISYPRYGGRGINICDRWRTSFENFYEDMGDPPTELHSLDRLESDGNYELGNCRWATKLEQTRNRSNSINITVGSVTLPLKDWCDRYGANYSDVWSRLFKLSWPIELALFAPKHMRLTQWKKIACVLGDFSNYMPIKE